MWKTSRNTRRQFSCGWKQKECEYMFSGRHGTGERKMEQWKKAAGARLLLKVGWHVGWGWEMAVPHSLLLRYHQKSSCFSSRLLLQLTLTPHVSPLLHCFFSSTLKVCFTGICWREETWFWEWKLLVRGCVVGWRGQMKCETNSLLCLSPHACLTWCQRGLQRCANVGFSSGPVGWSGRNILCPEVRDCKEGGDIY